MIVAGARVAPEVAGEARAYVGVGSNLECPVHQVCAAIRALDRATGIRLRARSALYRNPPIGGATQPDYVNAVAAIDTTFGPHALLEALGAIEARQGRERGAIRWAPRVIDLDLLTHGSARISELGLEVPHPRISERAFVLRPLWEVAPDLVVPGAGPVAGLLSRVTCESLVVVDDGEVDLPLGPGEPGTDG